MEKFKSGFVSIIGEPNVGKSTLLNCFLNQKIAIVTNKPQTTRGKITGILTGGDFQIVFIDTPGIHSPKHKLGRHMVKMAESAMNDMDCILFLVTPDAKISESNSMIAERLKTVKTPVILVINKVDSVSKASVLGVIEAYRETLPFAAIVPVSALNAENTNVLLDEIKMIMPEGPKYFPGDQLTDQPERHIASEMIRESALLLLQDEIPHGIAVVIENYAFRENQEICDIDAVIVCERETHKAIIIGKGGSMLKEIGIRSRRNIERMAGAQVNLHLFVKVKKGWRDSDFLIKSFGFDNKK